MVILTEKDQQNGIRFFHEKIHIHKNVPTEIDVAYGNRCGIWKCRVVNVACVAYGNRCKEKQSSECGMCGIRK